MNNLVMKNEINSSGASGANLPGLERKSLKVLRSTGRNIN